MTERSLRWQTSLDRELRVNWITLEESLTAQRSLSRGKASDVLTAKRSDSEAISAKVQG